MKRSFRLIFAILLISLFILIGCSNSSGTAVPTRAIGTIKFAYGGWDSIRIHNEIARIIIENGYGYKTELIPGSETASTLLPGLSART